jgi:hypothetical protein
MEELRGEFGEGDEDEAAQVQARVREREKFCGALFVAVEQEVQINRAWSAWDVASAAQRVFDAEESGEELFGGKDVRAFEFGNHVEEGGLVNEVYRLGFVN